PVAAAAHALSARVTSGPGGGASWDEGESVEVEVAFSAPVEVSGLGSGTPTVGVLLDGARREAVYTGGSGTAALAFAFPVTAAEAGARKARVVPSSLVLNGAAIVDGEGRPAGLGFAVAPYIASVALAPDASGDRRWSPGETIEVRLTFSEAVTVEGGTPWLDVAIGGFPGAVGYASGSGSATLAFSIGVPGGGEGFTGLAVVADSLTPNGARIASEASGLAAELGHDGTEPTAPPRETETADPLTAAFHDLPDAHGGAAFTFELRFSEEVNVSRTALRDSAFTVANGEVSAARQVVPGENRRWTITVTPAATGHVTVTLPASADCAAPGAVCTADGRALSEAVPVTVPHTVAGGTPFRVEVADLPDEHDGTGEVAFKVVFNKRPAGFSYKTLRDETLRIGQGGTALTPKVRRLLQGEDRNTEWQVTVAPAGNEDMSVWIGPVAACTDVGAVCTGEGEAVSNEVSETVPGPPGLSVADARVHEAAGAVLDFAVTLARASVETVTVDYATSDGTATAGADYEERSDTLSFAPGETAKTVSVPVLDDGHDEGEETMTLTLSNPRGGNAWLADATATGTIANSDRMPGAWLARFGRTVAEQVIEAAEGRFAAAREPGAAVSVAGQALAGASPEDLEALEEREAEERLAALSDWLKGGTDGEEAQGGESRALTGRDLFIGSSFALTGGSTQGGYASLWGRGAASSFDGREGELTLSGEVTSAMLGADWMRGRGMAGLMLMHSRGEGSYRGEGDPGSGGTGGDVSSTLTGLYPYGRYEVNGRVSVWGVAGYGKGELVLTPAGHVPLETDMNLAMGAVGVRGVALEAPDGGGLELSVTSDAMAVRTSSEAVRRSDGGNLAGAQGDVTRLRLGLPGAKPTTNQHARQP
ncbi:MAG: hypothetical protein OXE50_16105, partial [Chloroflexi bacterium]|nr:hypothetical protein [Chloroflexota bacterium]